MRSASIFNKFIIGEKLKAINNSLEISLSKEQIATLWTVMKPREIRQQGSKALIDALGVAGTLKFLQQLELGYGDYTKERYQWLDRLTIDDFHNYVKQRKVE